MDFMLKECGAVMNLLSAQRKSAKGIFDTLSATADGSVAPHVTVKQ